jgi:uncharacterized membrane protein
MGENHFTSAPVALYGVVLLCAAIAFTLLTRTLITRHGKDSALATAIGRDFKGKLSLAFYAIAIPLAFVNAWIACGIYILVAAIWVIPDPRIEKNLIE